MSIKNPGRSTNSTVQSNGHAVKRRKLSHNHNSKEASSAKSGVSMDDQSSSEDEDGASSRSSVSEMPSDVQVPSTKPQPRHGTTGIPSTPVSTSSTALPSTTIMTQSQKLISQVKPDYASRIKKMRPVADRIVEIIKAVPHVPSMSFAQAQEYSRTTLQVSIPWSSIPAPDIQYSFSFVQPAQVISGGHLMHNISTRDNSCWTIVPEIPGEIFQDKDYLNYRALHKRAFYIACIASALQREMDKEYQVRFSSSDDNEMHIVIHVIPRATDAFAAHTVFEIDPSLPGSLGPIEKMTPAHNCIRKDGLKSTKDLNPQQGTPFYNSTLRLLSTVVSRQKLLEDATRRAEHFRDACLLAAMWLQQRELSGRCSQGGFGHEEWAIICALLLESGGHQGRPLFSARYSAVQLFKAMLQVLGSRDMRDPFIVRGSIMLEKSNVPILFDMVTGVNILHKMNASSYAWLKHYATVSLAAMNSKKINGFDATFTVRVADTALEFDESYKIDFGASSKDHPSTQAQLYTVLARGLGDRANLIDLQCHPTASWKVASSRPISPTLHFTVGLLVNPDTIRRLVDHGPSIEEKEAIEQFREFWGTKAELRRFKNGEISESVVWSADTPITQQIIQYLCSKHFKLPSSSVEVSAVLENVKLASSVPAEEAFATVNSRLQSLASTLHSLDGLPLPIRSVSATSALARSASLALPLEAGIIQPIDMLIQFDSSGRWPDDLRAIQCTKIAFLTKIGDLLGAKDRTIETRIGIENTSSSALGTANTSYLDIIHASPSAKLSPLISRLRIYHDRETTLIQQALSSKHTLSLPFRETYQAALQAQKQTQAAISHTTAIRTLTTAFPPFSATMRLLKKFFAAHHLTLHIPPEIAEILAAQVFVNPAPWSTPGSATTAFTRCLHLLATWNWTSEPLIVDLSPSQDMAVEARKDLETRFAAWRKMDPNMHQVCWFVGTNIDTSGVVWTQGVSSDAKPARVVAGRITALASAAVELIRRKHKSEAGSNSKLMTKADWNEIFTSSLEDFDFVLHLNPSVVGGHKKIAGAKFKNLEIASNLDIDTTGIDTVESYLTDLQHSFGSVAVFFYAGRHNSSTVIGGLWRPHVRSRDAKQFKIRLGYSTVPVMVDGGKDADAEGWCKVNFESMLAEMGVMGEGIVDRITTNMKD